MECYHPVQAWQTSGGQIVFAERGSIDRSLLLPCGGCIGCRLRRSRSWAIRSMHEASLHRHNAFATLTYNADHYQPSLHYPDIQRWLKRLRRRIGPFRYFAAGEYGDQYLRPHYHVLLFGAALRNAKRISSTLFTSEDLTATWIADKSHSVPGSLGASNFGQLTYQSAAYTAKYSLKKITGPSSAEAYSWGDLRTGELVQVEPEHAHMSLRPGLGWGWFQKFWRDVYCARDAVIVDGREQPAPRYYDKLLDLTCPDLWEDKQYDRYINSEKFRADCTPERLADREICAQAFELKTKRVLT